MLRKTKKHNATAIFDIGHGTVRLVVIPADHARISTFSVATRGFSKGKVVDQTAFASAICDLVKSAGITGTDIRSIVNVPGSQTRTLRRSLEHRCGGTYTSADLSSIQDAAIEAASNELDEVIDVFFLQLTLDEKPLQPFAFGTTGRSLKSQALVATHPKLLLADILAGMNAGGIEVSEFRSNLFGLARALHTLRPEAENSVLIDIGHGSTTGVVAIGGMIQQVFSVAAGGQHMTRDLMIGLNTDFDFAENLKRSHGLAESSVETLPREYQEFGRYLRPRVAEILSLAGKNFAIYARALDGGLLLCGNGAQVPGLAGFTSKCLGVTNPFVCQLNKGAASAFLEARIDSKSCETDSGWLSLLSQARYVLSEENGRRFEQDSRPLSRLRPLWTWLSELSR